MSLLAMMQLIYQSSHYTIAVTVGEVPQLIYDGQSIIFGHSPHILRAIKICKQDLIIYSAGGFIDDYGINAVNKNDLAAIFEVIT